MFRNLEAPEYPVYSVKGHKEIINTIDGVGGLGIGEGAPEIVTGSRDGKSKYFMYSILIFFKINLYTTVYPLCVEIHSNPYPLNLTVCFFNRQVWLHIPKLFHSWVFWDRGKALNYFSFEQIQLLTTIVSYEPWRISNFFIGFWGSWQYNVGGSFSFFKKAESVLVKIVTLNTEILWSFRWAL